MINRTIIIILALMSVAFAYADVNTDRTMAKIARDTKTYISADARASTENEAYDQALSKLTEKVAEYLKNTDNSPLPEAVYLPQLSGIYDRITNQIDNNRYRVMLYVRKTDIKPVSNASGALVLSKTRDDVYSVLPTTSTETAAPVVVTDTVTVVQVIERPLDPTLSLIVSKRTKEEVTSAIQTLGQSGSLEGAAKFPINRVNDFYVAVIGSNDNVAAVLHCLDGIWKLVPSGVDANLQEYSECSGYWFTIPSSE